MYLPPHQSLPWSPLKLHKTPFLESYHFKHETDLYYHWPLTVPVCLVYPQWQTPISFEPTIANS